MDLPKFVTLNNTALRLRGNSYYRDAGNWSVSFKIINGVLLSWNPINKRLHRKRLIKITKEEYQKDNIGYV